MAKGVSKSGESKNGGKGAHNKHLRARIAYLNQVATYMALQQPPLENTGASSDKAKSDLTSVALGEPAAPRTSESLQPELTVIAGGLPSLYASHLRAVSLKSQVRLSQDTKRFVCKICNMPLIPGRTSIEHMENRSKGGKKSWADVSVIHCLNCLVDKRFPVGARRQSKKSARRSQRCEEGVEVGQSTVNEKA